MWDIQLIAAVLAASPFSVPVASAQGGSALAPVVVTATRQQQRAEDSLASVEVLEREDIERAGHSSLVQVLQALSGVRATANGGPGTNANVYIRGAEARHTLLLIDGMRVGSASSGAPTTDPRLPSAPVPRNNAASLHRCCPARRDSAGRAPPRTKARHLRALPEDRLQNPSHLSCKLAPRSHKRFTPARHPIRTR